MRTTTGLIATVILVAVVIVGAAALGLPATPDAAVAAPAEEALPPVRPPLQPHVVAARDAVEADRHERATRAAAIVATARSQARARWDDGDLPVTGSQVVLALAAALAMFLVGRRASG